MGISIYCKSNRCLVYLMSLLWGIRNLGGELLYADETMEITETYDRLRCWVKNR